MIYFIDTKGKASYTKSMKKVRIYTPDEYEKQIDQEKVFVNVTIATICLMTFSMIIYATFV